MGYRSCVGLCLRAESVSALQSALKGLSPTLQDDCASLFEACEFTREDEGCRAWYWEGFKWYTQDRDIRFLEEHLASLDWGQYLFIRVGEELDDIEYHGGFWDNPFGMCLTRGIGFDEE